MAPNVLRDGELYTSKLHHPLGSVEEGACIVP